MPRRTNFIFERINQPEQHLSAVPAEELLDALAPVLRVKPVIKEFCLRGDRLVVPAEWAGHNFIS